MPLASTTRCRLEPSLPLSVGLGPVSWLPGGLVPMSHRCWPGSNQSGRVRAVAPASPDAIFCQTPLAFQSRKRRQQVMPLP